MAEKLNYIYGLTRETYAKSGFNLTEADFERNMQDSGKRERLYHNLTRDAKGFGMSREEFESALGYGNGNDNGNLVPASKTGGHGGNNHAAEPQGTVANDPAAKQPGTVAGMGADERMEMDDSVRGVIGEYNAIARDWNEVVRMNVNNGDKENFEANRETTRNTFAKRADFLQKYDELYREDGKARYKGMKDASPKVVELMKDLRGREYASKDRKEYEVMDLSKVSDEELERIYDYVEGQMKKAGEEARERVTDLAAKQRGTVAGGKRPWWMNVIDPKEAQMAEYGEARLKADAPEQAARLKAREWDRALNHIGEEKFRRDHKEVGENTQALRNEIEEAKKEGGSSTDLAFAGQFVKDAEDALKGQSKYDAAHNSFAQSMGKHFEGFYRGAVDMDNIPWAGGVNEAARYASVASAVLKAYNKEPLDKGEQILIEAYMNYLDAQMKIESQFGTAYSTGLMAGESAAFMTEMVAFEGAIKGVGKLATKAGAKVLPRIIASMYGDFAVKKGGQKLAVKGVENAVAKFGTRTAGAAVQTGLQASTYANLERDRALALAQGREFGRREIAASVGNTFVEVMSENAFNGANGWALGKVYKGLDNMGLHIFGDLEDMNRFMRYGLQTLRSQPVEYIEEYEGAGMKYGLGILLQDEDLKADARQTFTSEGSKDMFLSFMLPGAISGGIYRGVALGKSRRFDKKRSALAEAMSGDDMSYGDAMRQLQYTEQSGDANEFSTRAQALHQRVMQQDLKDGKSYEEAVRDADELVGGYADAAAEYYDQTMRTLDEWNGMSQEERDMAKASMSGVMARLRNGEVNEELAREVGEKYGLSAEEVTNPQAELAGTVANDPAAEQRGTGADDRRWEAFAEYAQRDLENKVIDAQIARAQAGIDAQSDKNGNVHIVNVDGKEYHVVSESESTMVVADEKGNKRQVKKDKVTEVSNKSAAEAKEELAREMHDKLPKMNRFGVGKNMVMSDGRVGLITDQTDEGVVIRRPKTSEDKRQANDPESGAFGHGGERPRSGTAGHGGTVTMDDDYVIETIPWSELSGKDVLEIVPGMEIGGMEVSDVYEGDGGLMIKFSGAEGYIPIWQVEEMMRKQGVSLVENGKLAMGNDPAAKPQGTVADAVAEREKVEKAIEAEIKALESRFGVAVSVAHNAQEVDTKAVRDAMAEGKTVKGWYNNTSKSVGIFLPSIESVEEAKQIIFHEVVAHKGLREMFGEEGYAEVCKRVFEGMSEEDRARFLEYARMSGAKEEMLEAVAADEYMAFVAEEVAVNDSQESRSKLEEIWATIKEFMDALFKGDSALTREEVIGMIGMSERYLEDNSRQAKLAGTVADERAARQSAIESNEAEIAAGEADAQIEAEQERLYDVTRRGANEALDERLQAEAEEEEARRKADRRENAQTGAKAEKAFRENDKRQRSEEELRREADAAMNEGMRTLEEELSDELAEAEAAGAENYIQNKKKVLSDSIKKERKKVDEAKEKIKSLGDIRAIRKKQNEINDREKKIAGMEAELAAWDKMERESRPSGKTMAEEDAEIKDFISKYGAGKSKEWKDTVAEAVRAGSDEALDKLREDVAVNAVEVASELLGEVGRSKGLLVNDRGSNGEKVRGKKGRGFKSMIGYNYSDAKGAFAIFKDSEEALSIDQLAHELGQRLMDAGMSEDGSDAVNVLQDLFQSESKEWDLTHKREKRVISEAKEMIKEEVETRSGTAGNGGFEEDVMFRYVVDEDGKQLSERAFKAKQDGKYPKSEFVSRYGVAKKDFDALLHFGFIRRNEWHHTAKSFERRDFFEWGDINDSYYDEGKEYSYTPLTKSGGYDEAETAETFSNYALGVPADGTFGAAYKDNKKAIGEVVDRYQSRLDEISDVAGVLPSEEERGFENELMGLFGNEDVRFSLIGKNGAKSLDEFQKDIDKVKSRLSAGLLPEYYQAIVNFNFEEEKEKRIKGLEVAKKMQRQKKNAKEIKLATGWELGRDGEWRYEIGDVSISEKGKEAIETFLEKSKSDERYMLAIKTRDFADAPEFFAAYQYLFDDGEVCLYNDKESNLLGYYRNGTVVYLNIGNILDGRSEEKGNKVDNLDLLYIDRTLNHELQHYVQAQEMFAEGGTSSSRQWMILHDLLENKRYDVDVIKKYINTFRDAISNMTRLEESQKIFRNPKRFLNSMRHFEYTGTKEELTEIGQHVAFDDYVNALIDSREILYKAFGFGKDMSDYGMSDNEYFDFLGRGEEAMKRMAKEGYKADELMMLYKDVIKVMRKKIKEEAMEEKVEEFDNLEKALKEDSNHGIYRRLAGEVEARAVAKRVGLDRDVKRMSLSKNDEDIPRDRQIAYDHGRNLMNEGGMRFRMKEAEWDEMSEEQRAVVEKAAEINMRRPVFRDKGHRGESVLEYFGRYNAWREEVGDEYKRLTGDELPEVPRYVRGEMTVSDYLNAYAEYEWGYDNVMTAARWNEMMGKANTWTTNIVRLMYDSARRLEIFYQNAKAAGLNVDSSNNAYEDNMRRQARANRAMKLFRMNHTQPMMKAIAAVMKQLKDENKVRPWDFTWQMINDPGVSRKFKREGKRISAMEMVQLYCQAKDIIEAEGLREPLQRGRVGFEKQTGMRPEDVIAFVERVVDRKDIDTLWEKIHDMCEATFDYMIEAGYSNEEQKRAVIGERRFYVPERGFAYNEHLDDSTSSSPFEKAEGRVSLAANPFIYLQEIADSAIQLSERNRTKAHMWKFLNDRKNWAFMQASGAAKMAQVWTVREFDEEGNVVREGVRFTGPTAEEKAHDAAIDERIREIQAEIEGLRMREAAVNDPAAAFETPQQNSGAQGLGTGARDPEAELRGTVASGTADIRKEIGKKIGDIYRLRKQKIIVSTVKNDLLKKQETIEKMRQGLFSDLTEEEWRDIASGLVARANEVSSKDDAVKSIVKVNVDGNTYLMWFEDAKIATILNGAKENKRIQRKDDARSVVEAEKRERQLNRQRMTIDDFFSEMSLWPGWLTRLLSSIKTQYNWEFAYSNGLRDLQFAFLINFVERDVKFATEVTKNGIAMMPMVARYLVNENKFEQAEFESRFGKRQARWIKEFLAEGAETGYSFMQPISQRRRDYANELDKMVGQLEKCKDAKDVVKWMNDVQSNHTLLQNIGHVLEFMSQLSEMSTRMGQFVTERQHGKTAKEAALSAKEVTTNFNRHGELASRIGPFYMFYNATMQGTFRVLRSVYKDGKINKKALVKLMAAKAIYTGLGFFNAMMLPDDPDEETYIPDYIWKASMVLGHVTVPTPHFFRADYYLGVNIAKAVMGDKSVGGALFDAMTNMLEEMVPSNLALTSVLTWNEEDKVTGNGRLDVDLRMLRNLVPSAIQPLVDVYVNRNYLGAPVYKVPYVNNNAPLNDVHMAFSSTPDYVVEFCGLLQDITGKLQEEATGVPYRGWQDKRETKGADINPTIPYYIIKQYSGGTIDLLFRIATMPMMFTEDGIEARNIPFVGRVYKDFDRERMTTQYFWDIENANTRWATEYRNVKKGDDERSKRYYKESKYHDLNRRWNGEFKAIKRKVENNVTLTDEELEKLVDFRREWYE